MSLSHFENYETTSGSNSGNVQYKKQWNWKFVSLDKFSFIQRQHIAWISIENIRTQKSWK